MSLLLIEDVGFAAFWLKRVKKMLLSHSTCLLQV